MVCGGDDGQRRWRACVLFSMALVVTACAPLAPQPAPSADPDPVAVPAPPPPAVVALMDRSDGQLDEGDHDAAAASLERALRLDPQNAELWHRLARVRFAQADWSAAETLAMRSIGLDVAGSLRRDNWQLIAAARRQAGDENGAREAEARLRPGR